MGKQTTDAQKLAEFCTQSPGLPGYVPVDVDVAKFVQANGVTDTEAYSRSITAFNCHNLTGMCLNAGGLYHPNSFGCQPNLSPCPPHCVDMATGQTRGEASVLHFVIPAAQALLWHALCACVSACASLSIFVVSQIFEF